MYQRLIKRALDIILSLCAMIVLSVPMLALALWIKLDSPGPVLFTQKRIGRNKTHFNILKFRTMRVDAPHDMPTHLLQNPDAYITRSGRFLRKTSLDELPQVFNILVGQMSIVGPRPALWNQDDLIAQRDLYGANDITPGLTGWAQVNGRDELEIDEKARYDGEYAAHVTFKMDVTCFVMTIVNVLKSRGVVEGGTGTLAPHYEARREEIEEKQLGKGKKAG
ncbi:MAG: sugar transferase [Clostridia bacterium]|nr:sugar transferase [Clostridia bacterium]